MLQRPVSVPAVGSATQIVERALGRFTLDRILARCRGDVLKVIEGEERECHRVLAVELERTTAGVPPLAILGDPNPLRFITFGAGDDAGDQGRIDVRFDDAAFLEIAPAAYAGAVVEGEQLLAQAGKMLLRERRERLRSGMARHERL